MKYKGNEIEDKVTVKVTGVEDCIADAGERTIEEMEEFIERCKNHIERMKADGFKVVDYKIGYNVVEQEYDEEGGGEYKIFLTQEIEREETELESAARIENWKEYYDHLEEVMDKCDENHRKRIERINTDKNYAAYSYEMLILKRNGAKTTTYEKWCEKNKIKINNE